MRFDLIHLVAAGTFDHSSACTEDLACVVVFLLGDRKHCVDEFDVGRVNNRASDEAVGLVEDDFAQQAVDFLLEIETRVHDYAGSALGKSVAVL